MKIRFLIWALAICVIVSCKSNKDIVANQPPPQPPQQTKQLTDEEKDKLLQMEYKPAVKKLSEKDRNLLTSLAEEKATLMCKKQGLQKRIEAGEQINPNEITMIDSLLEELNKKLTKFSSDPSFAQFFDEKFSKYLKGCSN
jgi:hypothetical protein